MRLPPSDASPPVESWIHLLAAGLGGVSGGILLSHALPAGAGVDLVALGLGCVAGGLAAWSAFSARPRRATDVMRIGEPQASVLEGGLPRPKLGTAEPVGLAAPQQALTSSVLPSLGLSNHGAPKVSERLGPVVDGAALLEHVGGDRELIGELCGLLELDTPDRLTELESALRAGDAERVSRGAHALKGTFSAVFAVQARVLAMRIEECGRYGRLGELTNESALLRAEVPAVAGALRTISQQAAS